MIAEAEQIKSEENEDTSVAGTPKEEAKLLKIRKAKDEEPVEERLNLKRILQNRKPQR